MRLRIFALFLALLFASPVPGQNSQTKDGREAARQQLSQKGVKFDEENFIKAIVDGDAATVKQFLDAGMNPSAKDTGDVPAIIWAIRKGRQEIALTLIAAGADVNVKFGKGGDTPLIGAAGCGRSEIVEALLAKGAKIEGKDNGGHTAFLTAFFGSGYKRWSDKQNVFLAQLAPPGLKEAAQDCMDTGDGHRKTIELLIAKGADINIRATDGGETPLFIASLFADTELVRILLAHKVDASMRTWDNKTTLQWMIVLDSDLVRNDPAFKSNRAAAEWLNSTMKERAEIVRLLKEAGAQ
ncbi:MAG TPA: ankyrin repeat domain-containing protein [Pyrinomonadaceae bacterium]